MGLTPIYGFPYSGLNDSPNGPAQIQALAEAVEAKFVTSDAAIAALDAEVKYGDGGTYPSVTQNTAGTTTSGTFTATLTGAGATTCSLTFVAPASGKVDITSSMQISNSNTANLAIAAIEVRAGAVVGSGTVVLAAAIENGIYSGATIRGSVVTTVSGLTPGATYNVQQMYVVTGTTGSFSNKQLLVRPAA